MTAFYTDPEAAGAGEFLDTAGVGVRYTITAGTVTVRVYFPAIAPGGSQSVKIYDTSGTLLHTLTLATTNLSAWNLTTTSPVLAAGTYDIIWSTTRYKAIVGFFSGGSVTRGNVTGVTGRFNPTLDAAPSNNSTAGYVIDVDHVPSGGTPFTKDVAIQWRVLNTFTKDVVIQWRVLNTLTKDVAIQWNVLNSFTKDVAIQWRVLNTFTKDTSIVWQVQSGTAFTKDVALQWKVLNSFTKDTALQWRVLAFFTKDVDLKWNVFAATGITVTLWDGTQEIALELDGVWSSGVINSVALIEIT